MGECRGADWENAATHACFTSNPDETIAGFWPGGLKRLEMLLDIVHVVGWHFQGRKSCALLRG
jgi:hypothetical protein